MNNCEERSTETTTQPARSRLGRWLRDPVVHFIAIGGVLFWAASIRAGQKPQDGAQNNTAGAGSPDVMSREVRVPAEKLQDLLATFKQEYSRLPSSAELVKVAHDFVREEVLYREGLGIGLDRNDPVVRQRVIQLMQWYMAGSALRGEPTEAELRQHYQANLARYSGPEMIAFEQIFFSATRRGASAEFDAKVASETMKVGKVTGLEMAIGHGDSMGVDISVEEMQRARVEELIEKLGRPFIDSVRKLPPGEWSAPLRSTLGWHVVRPVPSKAPTFEELRQLVRGEVLTGRGSSSPDEAYKEILKRYDVQLDELPREVQK